MTFDYFLTKRKRSIQDWLDDHNILSVEGFSAELVRLGLEPSRESLVYVEELFKPLPVVEPDLQETKPEISEFVDSESVAVPPSSLPNKKSRKT